MNKFHPQITRSTLPEVLDSNPKMGKQTIGTYSLLNLVLLYCYFVKQLLSPLLLEFI